MLTIYDENFNANPTYPPKASTELLRAHSNIEAGGNPYMCWPRLGKMTWKTADFNDNANPAVNGIVEVEY